MLLCRTLLGVVTSLGLLAVGPLAVGLRTTLVMSDSMAPGIRAGDVVVVRDVPVRDVRVGQIVLVDDPDFPGRLRLHRIAARRHGEFVLKGDANAQDDAAAVRTSAVHGVGFLRVPWIGLPVEWLRTGHGAEAAGAIGLIGAAAAMLAVLDPGSGGAVARAVVLVRTSRRTRALGAASLTLLAVTGAAPGLRDAVLPSWAVFSASSGSPAEMAASTWTCTSLPRPAPDVLLSFEAPTGSLESNRGESGKEFDAELSTEEMRVAGRCDVGESPSVRFSGDREEALLAPTPVRTEDAWTQTFWFSVRKPTGVLASSGSEKGDDVERLDRQVYFTRDGRLAFAMRDGDEVVGCSIDREVERKGWHFAALTLTDDEEARTFVLSLDGTETSCTGRVRRPAELDRFTRLGWSRAIADDAAEEPFSGRIDEVATWRSVLDDKQLERVRRMGH